MKKILSALIVLFYILHNILSIAVAVNTDGKASPWTREKAAHLAEIALFNADKTVIDSLFAAGSASAAVNLIFPDAMGPDRTEYNSFIANYTGSGFNWGDANHTTRLYQLMYAADPYEAKRKLFSLFEDIFSVNRDTDRDITYKDVYELHTLLFENMFGNYQTLVKKVLYNNGASGDYAAGKFLDLFNQKDAKNPNENYARELLQLFLMGEYKPFESKDNSDVRNYEESDVKSLSRILTGLSSDAVTHAISFNLANHYSGGTLAFLTGSISGSFPYYNSASGTIDPMLILNPVNGNNGLTDNAIEYIFAQRSDAIALFLADRIARFYIQDHPSRAELDFIAQIIKNNNFEMLPSIKTILALDIVYADNSMNSIRYKNPLELNIGTIRFLRGNTFSGIVIDPNVYDTNLLRRVGWTPYFPGSIFGRDGFDDSLKWSSTSTQSAWMSASNYFTYRTTGTGAIDFLSMLGNQKKEITTGNVPVMTHTNNSYTGSMPIVVGSLELGNAVVSIGEVGVLTEREPTIEEQILANGYPLDPIESIYGGENLELFKSEIYEWIYDEPSVLEEMTQTIITPEALISEEATPEVVIHTGSEQVIADPVTDSGVVVATGELIGTTEEIQSEVYTGAVVTLPDPVILSEITTTEETSLDTSISTGTESDNTISFSGEVDITPIVESGSVETNPENSGSTQTGETEIISDIPPVTTETIIPVNAVAISTGSVLFPTFQINTNLGSIKVASGTYNVDTRTLTIHSGVLTQNGSGTQILSGSITFDMSSKLIADTIQPTEIIDIYETYIYGEKRLKPDVRTVLVDFISKDASGALMPVAPTNTVYFNKYIRGLLSILLSQPEYVLLHGYDLPTVIDDTEQRFLDNITGKLFFVELYGGNDYLTSIIPKDEYDTYLDYRSNQSGSIAITGTGLVDIGDFYMNAELANGSGGNGFKSLYDQGYLKIFNRVGGYRHSNDHDAAAKQITSYDSSTSISAEGAFGHLVKKEFESSHTISLGSKLPNIYRAGHFINLGGNVILSNPLDSGGQYRSHMDTMTKLTLARSFPGNTKNLFKDAGRISEIGKISVSQGGAPGASGDMNSVFKFAKVLMNNNIGRSFYMGGFGGYDTHGNQLNGLNRNLNFVSSAITTFFNEVKDTQDVTIVVFSEFGRTNKMNGDFGTDHGDGGGMYVITSNANLRNMLQAGTYGNMSIKNAKANALGIGVDYRSVYGSIFKSLYNLDGSEYFGTGVDIFKDISTAPNTISLLNYSYQASGTTPLLNVELTVTGSNFNPGKAGYTRLLSGTGLTNQRITRLNEKGVEGGYRYTFQINPNTQPYYSVESFSNQYAVAGFSGTLTGATRPLILANTVRQISQAKTSILPMFGSTMAPSKLTGSGIILESTGSNTLSIPDNNQIRIYFGSGMTNVTDLTYTSGSTTWRGGFILGEKIDRDLFIPANAMIVSDNKTLQKQNITHLFKMGADVRGVGMKLNQAVGIEFVGLPVGETYRAVSSEDGISWSDVELAGKLYQSSSTGSVYINTDHFSYFALVSNNAVEVPPSCSIAINPKNITNGGSATLSWSLLNVQTGALNPGNTILGTSGSILITPPSNATTPYTISVSNSAGTNSCTASVTASAVVVPPPVVLPPSCTISINPNSVVNGNSATLSWSLLNVQTGALNPGNTLLGTSGSILITPPSNATTPYTISVTNSAGTNSCTASVTATANNNSEFTQPATIASFTGKSIFVGVGKDFSTLRDAIASAVSGDKIYVDSGVYLSDYSVITGKNLAIIGLGSGAELKKVAAIPNQKAIIVSNTSNLYFENIIFSDSDVPDQNGAGIRYEGGTLTINNCTFQNNENGILGGATAVGQGRIWINNSRFLNNGRNGTGFTHAIYIGEMDYFEIKNSTVSGTSVGHHVKSRARNNVIENNILDDAGKDASYNIDLPNGGQALVKGNTIIQSALSPNRTMLSYSAEKNPPNAGSLLVENNIFQSFGVTAIGVNNFRNNQVILRNNTFINVSTKFTGNNIIDDSGSGVIVPPPVVLPPSCTISINPNSVVNGNSATLSWSLLNVQTGALNPGNTLLGTSGSILITPPSNATTPYTISVTNSAGTNSCTASVTASAVVVPPPVVPPVIPPVTPNPGGTITGPGGPSGGSSPIIRPIDNCPLGDTSGNYYDGMCVTGGLVSPITNPTPTNPTSPIVDSDAVTAILESFVSEIESKNISYVDADMDQQIYKTSIYLWREIIKNKEVKVDTALTILEQLQEIQKNSDNRAARIASARMTSILVRFMEAGGFDGLSTLQTGGVQLKNSAVSTISDSSNYKYVSAERSVTLRKNAYVGISNAIGYLTRNTQITVLSEINGWTKVLYNGIEGYIKSKYLRDPTSTDIARTNGLPSSVTKQGVLNVKQSAFVRNSPYFDARVNAVVYKNQTLTILDSISGWYEVLLENGSRGYIRKELISMLDPIMVY